jgi:hypothetical protein
MGYNKNQLKELTKPLYGFGDKRIKLVGVITLHVSFGTPKNPCTEHIIFDVVDIPYPYNAIFGWGLLNTFKAALHSAYLCLKILATFGVIIIFDSQKEAKNIELGLILEHKNVHFLREDIEHGQPLSKQQTSVEFKKAIHPEDDFARVALNPRLPDRTICIRAEMTQEEKAELTQFLDKINDVFTWSTSDLIGDAEK